MPPVKNSHDESATYASLSYMKSVPNTCDFDQLVALHAIADAASPVVVFGNVS